MRTSFFRSKTFLALLSFGIIEFSWWWATWHLYSLPPEAVAAFQAITTQSLWVVGVLALTIAGVKGVENMMSMKVDVANAAQTVAQNLREKKESVEEKIFRREKLDPKDVDSEELQ